MPTLNWIGRSKVVKHYLDVPYRVLDRKYSYDKKGQHEKDNGSKNMIIHGDNLEALKSLLPQYEEGIDCIYIDPPYNTGNQKWVYNDNVNDPQIQKWLGVVVGDDAEDLTRHDKWLCMMYPRLKLLWKLLSKSGVILISINEYEYANLKAICDEIFCEKNHVETFIWYIDGHTDNQDQITTVHEYILCYAKDKSAMHMNYVVDPNTPIDSKILNSYAENSITKNGFKNPPSQITLPIGFPCEVTKLHKEKHENIDRLISQAQKQGYITRQMTQNNKMSYPARMDEMIVENNALIEPCRVYSGWMNKAKLYQFIENNFQPIEDNGTLLRFYLTKNGVIYYRREGRPNHYVKSVLEKMGTTETNKYMLEAMGIDFDYPKPITLIEYLLSIFVPEGGIVLDSFAGSATTAHAALNLGKDRSFILIEMMDYAETNAAKRIKSVISNEKEVKNNYNFSYFELGEKLIKDNNLNQNVEIDKVRQYIYFMETKQKLPKKKEEERYLLGSYKGNAYYVYYEKDGITTLNRKFLHTIKTKAENYTIYADLCTLSDMEQEKYHITFKKIPRDIPKL